MECSGDFTEEENTRWDTAKARALILNENKSATTKCAPVTELFVEISLKTLKNV